jgi:hypothetical protein
MDGRMGGRRNVVVGGARRAGGRGCRDQVTDQETIVLKEVVMDKNGFAFWLTLAGTLCWIVCFWWMYRISNKQNILLDQLHAQGKRIEKLSRIEHDLIKEVHPQVVEIKEGVDTMVAALEENAEKNLPVVQGKVS